MNSYICTRDGNALEWITVDASLVSLKHAGQRGRLVCWHCEQRLRNGLPLLPERVEVPIEALRLEARTDKRDYGAIRYDDLPRYRELTQGIREARQMNAEFNRCARLKAERRARGLRQGGWTDIESRNQHLRWIAAERERNRRLAKDAEQFALDVAG